MATVYSSQEISNARMKVKRACQTGDDAWLKDVLAPLSAQEREQFLNLLNLSMEQLISRAVRGGQLGTLQVLVDIFGSSSELWEVVLAAATRLKQLEFVNLALSNITQRWILMETIEFENVQDGEIKDLIMARCNELPAATEVDKLLGDA